MQQFAQQQYQKANTLTTDKGKMVVLLYDGAINFLQRAKHCIQKEDVPGKCNNINRASDIIQELNFSLDTEAGGELAQTLRRLYLFMNRQLVQAKIDHDGTKQMDEVIGLLKPLNDAWRTITTKHSEKQAEPHAEHQAEPARLAQNLTA